jgi:PTH1 family peptidyl-tRNA hydrolase
VLLVVGLGNPGAKYQNHRHNVGFMVVDRLAERDGRDPFREKFQGLFARAAVSGDGANVEYGLLKPQTFMNLSGQSAQKALAFFKLERAQLVVVHDELDLEFGTLRVKLGGGSAGHNGIKSLAQCCGGPEFVRVRVGIGRPRSGRPEQHVLSDFSRDECLTLPDVLESASLAVRDIALRGVQVAMNRHNQATSAKSAQPTPARPERAKDDPAPKR